MSGAPSRVFVARLAGFAGFDPPRGQGGRGPGGGAPVWGPPPPPPPPGVGGLGARAQLPRAVGVVVEVPGRRRVFVPMTRVTSMNAGQVITTGLVNMRRFEQRPTETLILGEMLDRTVDLNENGEPVTVEDVAIEQGRRGEWRVTRVFVRRGRPGPLRRR